jgi:hypothetical protein
MVGIIEYFKKMYMDYLANKKSDELYNKLHRHDGVKFTQKEYQKTGKKILKDRKAKSNNKKMDKEVRPSIFNREEKE